MKMTLKMIIAGGRDFNDYELLKSVCESIVGDDTNTVVVSGGAIGADSLGEKFAREKNLLIRRFNADWKKYKKSAGPLRNAQMAEYGNYLVAFWDGKSKGTKNMIETAKRYGIVVKIINY